jgi:poly [ADP-ribose] polymerase
MATVIEHKKYVAVNPLENNNKFWEYSIYDDNTMTFTYGRIDVTSTTTKPQALDRKKLNTKIREKLNDKTAPYTEIQIVASKTTHVTSKSDLSKEQLKKIAEQEIGAGCPVVSTLVKRLAEANRHEIIAATGGAMNVDLSTGMVSTAMGVITGEAIAAARVELGMMSKFVVKRDFDNPEYVKALGSYLRLVPQQVPSNRGWHRYFMADQPSMSKQATLLDQLETSVDLASQRLADAAKAPTKDKKPNAAPTFEVTLKVIDDPAIIKMVNQKYSDTLSTAHISHKLKPVRVYEVDIPHMSAAFEKDGRNVGNIQMLWHGTRMFNVLSIMKRGLILPKALSTMQIAGAMFGPGLYFSDQSTKSLNYSFGYWDGGKRDSTCYMFLSDVAMGKSYLPTRPENGQRTGYDSCFAIGGKAGVLNNEMIVYRTSQANLRYLVEFSE